MFSGIYVQFVSFCVSIYVDICTWSTLQNVYYLSISCHWLLNLNGSILFVPDRAVIGYSNCQNTAQERKSQFWCSNVIPHILYLKCWLWLMLWQFAKCVRYKRVHEHYRIVCERGGAKPNISHSPLVIILTTSSSLCQFLL